MYKKLILFFIYITCEHQPPDNTKNSHLKIMSNLMEMIPDDIMRNHIIPYKLDLEARDKVKNQLKNIQKSLNDLEDNFVSDLSDLILEYDCTVSEKEEKFACNYLHDRYLEERVEEIRNELICQLIFKKHIVDMIRCKYDQKDCCECCSFDCRACCMLIDLNAAVELAYVNNNI